MTQRTDLIAPPRARSQARWSPLAWASGALFAGLVIAAFFVAAAAAAIIALIVAVAAIVLRLMPRRARAEDARVLEGRRTAEGWVVEAAAPR
jgi:hypothetical protein